MTKVEPLKPLSAPGVRVVAKDAKTGTEIREFINSRWQEQINEAVAQLPKGARGAVVLVGTKTKQQLAVVARPVKSGWLKDRFSVVGTLSHTSGTSWKTWEPEVAARLVF